MTPVLSSSRSEAFVTDELKIYASGLTPGEQVRISAHLTDMAGVEWVSYGDFIADHEGRVDLSEAPSESGTYTGVDVGGLFWSMRPGAGGGREFVAQASAKAHKLGQPDLEPTENYDVIFNLARDDDRLADCKVRFKRLSKGIRQVSLSEGSLRGQAFMWEDRSVSRGAIMCLTGSNGGVELSYAPALASAGYDVLSLAYFAYDDLPSGIAAIPLEYFEAGFQWMQRTFGVDRVGVQGASRGGELSLLLAAHFPEYVLSAVAFVPMYASASSFGGEDGAIGPSWTLGGEDIPYAMPTTEMNIDEARRQSEGEPHGLAMSEMYMQDFDRPEVRQSCAIPVERARADLLLVSGVDDQMWPSHWGSDLVVNRLRAKGYALEYRHLALREAGHRIMPPNTVTTFAHLVLHDVADLFLACGGTPHGAALAGRRAWTAIIEHYARVFGDEAPPSP
ncbi:MAG: alpha/beta fold hydrolase [Haliea sp.]|uniref:acyl-CoA thioesterase/bile acid-CoA:amino acid N-acyltransferase family protein n=1 Tax=Marinobacter salarius TaxID=1420917 RepID=UPI0032EED1B2